MSNKRHIIKIEIEVSDDLLRADPSLLLQALSTVASIKIKKTVYEILKTTEDKPLNQQDE
ncbi:MAG TPA: hypothetical protein ENI23_17130 [bacterium]|nr:hypothetical protein [bacterium]